MRPWPWPLPVTVGVAVILILLLIAAVGYLSGRWDEQPPEVQQQQEGK